MKKNVIFIVALLLASSLSMRAMTEREALVAIYKALNGPEWEADDAKGWNTNAPIKEWKDVTTDATGEHVEALQLRADDIKGYLPAAIGELKSLKYLKLRYKDREADAAQCIPAEVWTLPELVDIDVYIAGKGTYTLPKEINCPKLNTIKVNKLQGSFDVLLTLPKLVEVCFEDVNGDMPENIGELTKLRRLTWKSGNDPTKRIPASLGKCSMLESLILDNSTFTKAHVGNIEFPAEVWDLTNLKYLFLRNIADKPSTIPADKVAKMTRLENVILCRVSLEGNIPAEFFTTGNMKQFDVYENFVTGSIPKELGNCIKLTTVQLNNNNLTGSIPEELGNCPKLRNLNLSKNPDLGGKVPESFVNCPDLAIFKVDGTQVDSNVSEPLKAHPKFSRWKFNK